MKRVIIIAIAAAVGFFGASTDVEACCGAYFDPIIDNVSCEPGELWPPNHKYRDVMVTADVTPDPRDYPNVTADWRVVRVESDQPENSPDLGDGDTVNDCYVEVAYTTDPETGQGYGVVKARAERCGDTAEFLQRGRTYTIVLRAWARGQFVTRTAETTCQVYVPHDLGPAG